MGTSPNHLLNCFRVMFSRKTLLLNMSQCFCEHLRVKKARFLRLLNVLCFLVLSVTISKPPRMMSSSANYRPFLSSFRHIPPQEYFCQVSKLTSQTEHGRL